MSQIPARTEEPAFLLIKRVPTNVLVHKATLLQPSTVPIVRLYEVTYFDLLSP